MMGETPPGAGASLPPARLADAFVPPGETPETIRTTNTTSSGYFVVTPTHKKRPSSAVYSFRTTKTTNTTGCLADACAGAHARAARGYLVVFVVFVVRNIYIYIYQSLILIIPDYKRTTIRGCCSIAGAGRPGGASRSLDQLEPGGRLGGASEQAPSDRVARVPIRQRIGRRACRRSRSAPAMGRGGSGSVHKEILSDGIKWRISAVFSRRLASDKTPGRTPGGAAAPATPRRGRADRAPSRTGGSTVPGKNFGKKWKGRPRAGVRSHGEDVHQL